MACFKQTTRYFMMETSQIVLLQLYKMYIFNKWIVVGCLNNYRG